MNHKSGRIGGPKHISARSMTQPPSRGSGTRANLAVIPLLKGTKSQHVRQKQK